MDDKLVDVGGLAPRLRILAGVLAALTLAAVVVDGLRNGLTFALLGRWAAVFAAALVILAALLVAVQAVRGAGSAARRGERLTSSDVGLVPPRRSSSAADDVDAGDGGGRADGTHHPGSSPSA